MGKRLTRQDLLDRVNKARGWRGKVEPLTMKNFQRAVFIARQKQLIRRDTIDRLAKGR